MVRQGDNESVNARSLLRAMTRRKGVIVASLLAFAGLGVALNELTPPVYRATVRIEIRRAPDLAPVGSSNFQSENQAMYTAAALITSRTLLDGLAEEIQGRGWIPEQSWQSRLTHRVAEELPGAASKVGLEPGAPSEGGARAPRSADVDWLESAIRVEPVPDTRLVDVHVEHEIPEAARVIADRLAARFIDHQSRWATEVDSSATTAARAPAPPPTQVVYQERPRASGETRAILRNRVRSLESTLAQAQREQSRVQSEMSQANARLGSIENVSRDANVDLTQISVSGGAVEALRRDLTTAQSKMAGLKETYLDKHPKVVAQQAEIDGIQDNLRREIERVAQQRRAERAQLASREASLRSTLAEKENEMRAAEAELGQAEQTERVAVRVARTVGPVRVEAGTVQPVIPRIAVVDAADVAPNPVRPRKALNLAVCLAAGLLVGLALNLLRDTPRHTIRTPEDFETEFELPVLGVMPRKPSASVA